MKNKRSLLILLAVTVAATMAVTPVTVFADGYDPMSVQNFDYIEVQVLDPMEWNDLTAANDNCPSLTGLEGEAGIISDLKADGYEVHD